jgi:methionyl-tRNA formyltransferase
LKIVFIGGVEIGLTVLESVYHGNDSVDTVFTLPHDSKASGYIDFEPITTKHQSNLIRTSKINDEIHINAIQKIAPDLIIVCGWQRLISQEILDIPRLGTVGFHSSLLPKYRGRAPVNWAMIMGEKETGITMFYLNSEADTGDIIAQESFHILLDDDCHAVYKKSAKAGANLIKSYLPLIAIEKGPRIHNPSKNFPAYPKRTPEDGLIDFNRSALDIYNFVRALTKPYPGAYFFDKNGQKIIVWKLSIIFDGIQIKDDTYRFKTQDLDVLIVEYEVRDRV